MNDKQKKKNPNAVALGRLGGLIGGRSRSAAKQRASRNNGKLGGRPRKDSTLNKEAENVR